MEKEEDIKFLPKPTFNKNLIKSFKTNEKPSFYTNLFKLTLNHPIKIYQYPYLILPEVGIENRKIRRIIFRRIYLEIKETFGNFYQSGDSIYSLLKIEYSQKIRTSLIDRETNRMIEYEITFEAYSNKRETELANNSIKNSPLCKNLLELIINDILSVNPNVSFNRDLIIYENEDVVKFIPSDTKEFKFYPGYLKNILIYDNICYLNVNLKHRVVSRRTILEMINDFRNNNGVISNQKKKELKKILETKSFKGNYSKKNYKIFQLNFDRNPQNTQFNYDGKTVNLIQYYKLAHNYTEQIIINQPIIIVKRKIKSEYAQYFLPQLCYLCAIPDWRMQDGNFAKELAQLTKFSPKERIEKTNSFLNLLHCTLHKKITVEQNGQQIQRNLPSSEELFTKYGLKIDLPNEKLEGIYIKTPEFLAEGTNTIQNLRNLTRIRDSIPMNKYLLIYPKRHTKIAYIVTENLQRAGEKLNINICIPDDDDCIEIEDEQNVDTWISAAEKYHNDYDFVLFLIDNKKEDFYSQIKINSLCEVGYISQVIRIDKLKKNLNNLSVYSKILLQLNSKLGGLSYTINFKKENQFKKVLIIGVDSSHIHDIGTGIAMVASDNFSFTYCHEYIIEEKNVETLQFKIASFLNNVILEYMKKKNELPNQIIIYRQGVSKEQKKILKEEINQIDDFLNGRKKEYIPLKNKIPYYYILVNKKTSWKFFEVDKKEYYNPNEGLLIYDEITNPDIFEFYIQPQKVQSGSATPTCFHVAFGNLNQPEFIMKFTYDLCYLYPNWSGAVRVPHVLKAAEKLSYMTAKYTNEELITIMRNTRAYL